MPEPNESNQNPQGSQGSTPAGTDGNAAPPASAQAPASPDIQKLIQASEDRVRTQYVKELKQRDQMIEELRQATMTEAQIRKLKETQLSERETALQRKELELHSVNVLRENDLPLELKDFLTGNDNDAISAKGATLKATLQRLIEKAVQDKFKTGGREPAKAGDPPTAGKRSYTRAEAEELSKKVQDISIPKAEREALQAELLAAMQENRIR